MPLIKEIIHHLFQVSLLVTTIQIYLQINKIWKRKHEREVAESQSIAGLSLLFFSCIVSISYYVWVQQDSWSAVETSLYLFQSIILGLISTGIFVKGRERLGFWLAFRSALRLERKEASYLIKKFFKPSNAESIINILHQLAMIDDNLDPKELELLEAFAEEWKISYSADEYNKERSDIKENNFISLRKSLSDYLSSDPPKEQVAQLRDMMKTLIHVDDQVSPEEELIAAELMGLIAAFLKEKNAPEAFDVLIVPQMDDHHAFIREIAPQAESQPIAGGTAYTLGKFYSKKFAELICNRYREVHLFTIVHEMNDPKSR